MESVLGLWIRPVAGGPMAARSSLTLVAGRGIVGDHALGRLRHVTVLFEEDWKAAARTVGRQVDPAGRRANVLVTGSGAPGYLKSKIRLGSAILEVKGITTPCPVMERAAAGMMEALRPDGRGGIWGRVVLGGELRIGDRLEIVEASPISDDQT